MFLFGRVTKRTRRVSVRSDGGQADGRPFSPAISADGRWITYTSNATNLVDDDTNDAWDVFLFDRVAGTTRRVSVRSDGGQAAGCQCAPTAISADGRWIAYTSAAANLVDDDTNDVRDVFLFDRVAGTTRRVSVRSDGGQGDRGSTRPAISADGRWITYTSWSENLVDNDTNDVEDVFLFDRDTGQTRRVSVRSDGGQATGGSNDSALSADGRWITYNSTATNLVDDYTNGRTDVFLFDRDTGQTRQVSTRIGGGRSTRGGMYPAVSGDGRWVTYYSYARNLVDDDTNGKNDVFLFDRDTGLIRRVSVRTDGGQADGHSYYPAISANGRWVTYYSYAANLVDNDTYGRLDVFLTRLW